MPPKNCYPLSRNARIIICYKVSQIYTLVNAAHRDCANYTMPNLKAY